MKRQQVQPVFKTCNRRCVARCHSQVACNKRKCKVHSTLLIVFLLTTQSTMRFYCRSCCCQYFRCCWSTFVTFGWYMRMTSKTQREAIKFSDKVHSNILCATWLLFAYYFSSYIFIWLRIQALYVCMGSTKRILTWQLYIN